MTAAKKPPISLENYEKCVVHQHWWEIDTTQEEPKKVIELNQLMNVRGEYIHVEIALRINERCKRCDARKYRLVSTLGRPLTLRSGVTYDSPAKQECLDRHRVSRVSELRLKLIREHGEWAFDIPKEAE